VLLDPTPFSPTPEKTSAPNNPSLRGFELIDAIKDALEAACPGVVSCADIIAFVARDESYFLSGGKLSFDMPAGRLDGTFSNASESLKFLVPPTSNLSTLVSSFAVKGMSVEDLVVVETGSGSIVARTLALPPKSLSHALELAMNSRSNAGTNRHKRIWRSARTAAFLVYFPFY